MTASGRYAKPNVFAVRAKMRKNSSSFGSDSSILYGIRRRNT